MTKHKTKPLDDVRSITMARSLASLRALNAKFTIEWNGLTYTSGNKTKPPTPRNGGKPAHYDHVAKHDYISKMGKLQPGDDVTFQCDTVDEMESLQSAVSTQGVVTRGKGGVVTHRERSKKTVIVLAIAPLREQLTPA